MDVYVLKVAFDSMGIENILYPVIIKSDSDVILVDCGYAGFMSLLEKAANGYHLSLQELTGVLITHHDIDHMGGLFELKEAFPAVTIYSSATEAPYISGKTKSLRLQQAEDMYESLPKDQRQVAFYFQKLLQAVRPVQVEAIVSAEEESSFLKGVTVIDTPGHMPGHISLYVNNSKTLIAADAIVVEGDELEIANPDFTLDMPQAIASVKKLRELEIEQLICYHGGIVTNNISSKLDKLIAKYSGKD